MSRCLELGLRLRPTLPLLMAAVLLVGLAQPGAAQGQSHGSHASNGIRGGKIGKSDKSQLYLGVGRNATAKEVAAWDIDVRPDFKGLPPGSGSVALGQQVWEGQCAHCHGIFGESGEVFSPLVGGTSAADIKTGRVARLLDPAYPGRTTLMKVATVSTLWDYINRAMPWTAPKSLSTQEVYAVTAFLLNLGGIVPDDYVLSDQNIAQVQERMPNRKGMTTEHALWPGTEFGGARRRPDTRNVACMRNCLSQAQVTSQLPEYARDTHGNLVEQNRPTGAQQGHAAAQANHEAVYGARTDAAASEAPTARAAAAKPAIALAAKAGAQLKSHAAQALLDKYACTACHAMDKKLFGPSFQDIAKKHAGQTGYLAVKIKSGGSGVWGPLVMPAQALSPAEAKTLAAWLAAGAAK